MANWVDIPESNYKKTVNWSTLSGNKWGGEVWLTLQYDKDSVSATSVKIRWKLNCKNNSWNYYYLLVNPHDGKDDGVWGTLIPLKTKWTENKSGGYPYYQPENGFTLYKGTADTSYTLPPYWLCNDGYDVTDPDTAEEFYKCYSKTTYTNYKNDRPNALTYEIGEEALTEIGSEPVIVTAVQAGSVEIIDNYNNSFTVRVNSLGTGGLNNLHDRSILKISQRKVAGNWQSTTSDTYDYQPGSTVPDIVRTLSTSAPDSSTNGKKLVWAQLTVYGKSDANTATSYANSQYSGVEIKHFVAPSKTGAITLSYNKKRLTIKEPWQVSWGAATKANDSSPVKGYSFAIKRDGEYITGLTVDGDNNITKGTGSNTSVLIHNTDCTCTFDPAAIGLVAHNLIDIEVLAFTRSGQNNDGNDYYYGTGSRLSDSNSGQEVEVQNAGIMRVFKAGLGWTEAQVKVYRKTNGVFSWQEAEAVKVNRQSTWRESQ